MQKNDELEIQLRKNMDTLKIVGKGVIVFGIWTIIKVVLYSTLQWDSIYESMADEELTRGETLLVYVFLLFIIFGSDIAIRLYVGCSAIAEGRGRRKRPVYIVAAFILLIFSVAWTVLSVLPADDTYQSPLDTVMTVIVEATSCITLLEMCLSAIRVRRLRRRLAEQG
jgi:hypothetical protein